jgi:hypothetical protein
MDAHAYPWRGNFPPTICMYKLGLAELGSERYNKDTAFRIKQAVLKYQLRADFFEQYCLG